MLRRLSRFGAAALCFATIAIAGCGVAGRALQGRSATAGTAASPRTSGDCGPAAAGVLSAEEREWADAAWRYVETNTNATTGLVNGADQRAVATMWDVADAIAALVSARELGLIDRCTFDRRFGPLVAFLNNMPIVDNIAPNRWYDAAKGTMIDAAQKPSVVGWSAMDLGRLMVWLRIVEARYAEWSPYIGRAISRWNYCAIVDACGTINRGVHTGPFTNRLEQDGRLGYEEYAAAGFAIWRFETGKALQLDPVEDISVEGVPLLRDARDAAPNLARAPLTTTPFAAYEMEIGGTLSHPDAGRYREVGRAVAEAQYQRYRRQGIMTARGGRPLVTPPWHVFDSVWAEGYAWNSIDPSGGSAPHFALLSTASVFELWAAYPDDVAQKMVDLMCSLRDAQRGFYAGRFERTGGVDTTITLRTNAAVLESLMYRRLGVIYKPAAEPGWFEVQSRDEFFRPGRCLPGEERRCGEECVPFGLRPPKTPRAGDKQ